MPATPMTPEEIDAQCKAVSLAAQATDYFTDDELEAYAASLAVAQDGGAQ